MICGHFEFDAGFDHPLLDQLPQALVVRWEEAAGGSPVEEVFRFIAREVHESQPGHDAVARRLSEVLFVQAVRHWVTTGDHRRGVLSALADPGLRDALSAIHADPAERWTLDTLARQAAMGRTAFAERFREAVGETPHRYLTGWRVQNARRLLRETRLSLERIAVRVGYDSAASFSRTFKKVTGSTPGVYRRKVRTPGDGVRVAVARTREGRVGAAGAQGPARA